MADNTQKVEDAIHDAMNDVKDATPCEERGQGRHPRRQEQGRRCCT